MSDDLSRICQLAGLPPPKTPILESAPPGKKAEDFIRHNKKAFKQRYGKKWSSYLYGTAWKQFGESLDLGLRDYVRLIEAGWQQQPQRGFGRKGTVRPDLPNLETGAAGSLQNQAYEHVLNQCRQYPTAEAYAEDHNQYLPVSNTDPPNILQRAEAETERLKRRWNLLNDRGLLRQR